MLLLLHYTKILGLLAPIALSQLLVSCAFISNEPKTIAEPTVDSISQAKTQPKKIKRVLQTKRMALDSLPVGSIIAFFPSNDLSLPENWAYCDGSVVRDEESAFYNTKLPNLMDDRFLMGTISKFALSGGDNEIRQDGEHIHLATSTKSGAHEHTGLSGIEENNGVVKPLEENREINVRITEQGHKHVIQKEPDHSHEIRVHSTGVHDHGGEARPRYFGVLYIIKVK